MLLIKIWPSKQSANITYQSALATSLILLNALFLSACNNTEKKAEAANEITEPAITAVAAASNSKEANLPSNSTVTLSYPAEFPVNDSVNNTHKYYKIRDLISNQEYTVNLNSTESAMMSVYEQDDFTSSVNSCSNVKTCKLLANESSVIYIKVDSSNESTYSLNMTLLNNFEGSPDSPVILNSRRQLPYTSTAKPDSNGYYQITGLKSGHAYQMHTAMSPGASTSLYVHKNSFSSLACSSLGYSFSTGSDEACTFTANAPTIWVRVKGIVAGKFTLSIKDKGEQEVSSL